MPVVSLDFETYSETDLKKVGAWAYACHPTTEVLCMAYAIDDGDPILWLPGQPLPLCIINYGQFTFRAWNSFFEWCIWTQVLHWPKTDISQWEDTAARAAALAMPRSSPGHAAQAGRMRCGYGSGSGSGQGQAGQLSHSTAMQALPG